MDFIIPQDLPGLEPKTREEVKRLFEHIYELAQGIEGLQRQLRSTQGAPPITQAQLMQTLAGLGIPLIGGTQDPEVSEVGTGAGSVSSVGVAIDPSANGFAISGSPVTSSGTITISISSASAVRDSIGLSTKTGWTAATGTATRTSFDTTVVTLPELAERLKALLDDALSLDLIGA